MSQLKSLLGWSAVAAIALAVIVHLAAMAFSPPADPPPAKYITATVPPRYTWVCYDPTRPDGSTLAHECQRLQLAPDGTARFTGEVVHP